MDTIGQAAVEIGINGVDKVKAAVGQVKGLLGNLGITPATLGIVGVGSAIAFAVKKAMDWEQHNEELKSKLEAMGENAESATKNINSLAKSISTVTTESAGHVKALVMQAMNMGATAEEAQKLATIAIGAGKATGKSAEEILEGTVKLQNGMRNALDRSIPAVAAAGTQTEKLAAISKLAGQGFQQYAGESHTTKNAMEQLSKTISGLYKDLGEAFLPVVKAVVVMFQDVVDWVKAMIASFKEFGGNSSGVGNEFNATWGQVSKFFEQCGKYIGDVCTWIVKQFMLIPAYGSWIGTSMMNLFMNLIPAYLKAFGANFAIMCKWLWDNWRDIFTTIWNYVKAGFTNTMENIKSLWNGLLGFFKGKGFHVNWKPLTDGAVNTIKQMPQFVKAQTDPIWDKMQQEADKQLAKAKAKAGEIIKSHLPTAEKKEDEQRQADSEIRKIIKNGLKPGAKREEKDSKSGSSMSGVLDVWKNAQQSLVKNDQKEQLRVAKQQLKEQQTTNKALQAIAGKRGGGSLTLSRN